MDVITIENLEFIAYHGVYQEEKRLGQKFLVSVSMETDVRKAGKTGKLEHTIHYGQIARDVEKNFTEKSFDLLETCAETIAEFLLTKYGNIRAITITIKKPWAPLKMHFEHVSVTITRRRSTVWLSLGANTGERKKNLESAMEALGKLRNTKLLKVSAILETKPFGYPDQPDFLNCAAGLTTLLTPRELLEEIHRIEAEHGRDRNREIHWGPRSLDIDILLFGDLVTEEDDLILPHPYLEQREFVLAPLTEIAPFALHPLLGKRMLTLLRELRDREKGGERS